jgi:soluble lytic murein transglycosylase-like protein
MLKRRILQQKRGHLAALLCSITLLYAASALAAPPKAAAEAYANGDPGRAITLIAARSADPESRLLRARALLDAARPTEAAAELRGLASTLPFLRDYVLFLRAEAARQGERYVEAAALYKQAIKLRGSRWVDLARERRAASLLAAKRHRQARHAFRLLLRSDDEHPRRAQLELGLARAEVALGLRKQAARRLRELWLSWPERRAAVEGKQLLDTLTKAKRRRVVLPALSVERLYDRAQQLYRAKRWDDAIAQLKVIATQHPVQRYKASWRQAWVLWKASRYQASLRALEPLAKGKSVSWKRLARRHRARVLARLGKVDQAVALYTAAIPAKGKRITPAARRAMAEQATVLAEHGRYKEALVLVDRLAGLLSWSKKLKRRATWLAFRAGDYERALIGFAKYYRPSAFRLYWTARAEQLAGRFAKAEPLYNQLVERHLRSYYGILARGRLVEQRKVTLAAGTCSSFHGAGRVAPLPLLDSMTRSYGELLPELYAARALWRSGLRVQARRHLRLAILDYTWAVYRKAHAFRIRLRPLRLWRGGKLRRLPFGKRARALRTAKLELGPQLGKLAYATGLEYLGWRLSPKASTWAKRVYPRAWAPLVVRMAKRFDLDPNLLWAVMNTESRYRPDVISRVNAGGLMQLMPNTAKRLADELKLDRFAPEHVFRPEVNLLLAGQYLRAVWRKFNGQVPLVAAAYNGGPHNVARWLDARGKGAPMDAFIEEIPFAESKRYAKKIVRLMALYERTYCEKDDRVLSNSLDTSYLPKPNY